MTLAAGNRRQGRSQAEGCRGPAWQKLLAIQQAFGSFGPTWLFCLAIASVSNVRIVCRSVSSLEVLRRR